MNSPVRFSFFFQLKKIELLTFVFQLKERKTKFTLKVKLSCMQTFHWVFTMQTNDFDAIAAVYDSRNDLFCHKMYRIRF